jgi:putative transposase
MQGLTSRASVQSSLEVHVAVYNTLNIQRHLQSRQAMYVLRACSESVWSGAVT